MVSKRGGGRNAGIRAGAGGRATDDGSEGGMEASAQSGAGFLPGPHLVVCGQGDVLVGTGKRDWRHQVHTAQGALYDYSNDLHIIEGGAAAGSGVGRDDSRDDFPAVHRV